MKRALDDVNLEHENSRKGMHELQLKLQLSTFETRKFEELHKQMFQILGCW